MKTFMIIFSLAVIAIVALVSNLDQDVPVNPKFPYEIDRPSKTLKLDKELVEISGLTYLEDNMIGAVQDEKGEVFIIDLSNGKTRRSLKFGKNGDYEGITNVDNVIYVARSDGHLYKFKNRKSGSVKTKEFKTRLSEKNDVEGLCYDVKSKELLIACKSNPGIEKFEKNVRAIYGFNIATGRMDEIPRFKIDLKEVNDYISTKLGAKYKRNFMPSGIAVHPLTNNIYIISAVGKLILIMDRKGQFVSCSGLSGKSFSQPEGICFDESANLYISNEGRDKKAFILIFPPGLTTAD